MDFQVLQVAKGADTSIVSAWLEYAMSTMESCSAFNLNVLIRTGNIYNQRGLQK